MTMITSPKLKATPRCPSAPVFASTMIAPQPAKTSAKVPIASATSPRTSRIFANDIDVGVVYLTQGQDSFKVLLSGLLTLLFCPLFALFCLRVSGGYFLLRGRYSGTREEPLHGLLGR